MVVRIFLFLAIILGVGLAFSSCHAPKKIQTAIKRVDSAQVVKIEEPHIDSSAIRAEIANRVNSQRINYKYFFAKIKVDYTDVKGKNTNANAFVRLSKDSMMWVSLTGALGIEGFRILLTPDSVQVMDKLEKTISRRSVAYLQDIIKLPVDFYTLQDLIVGNPVFFSSNIVSYKYAGESLMALAVGNYFKHVITVDTATNRITHSKLDDVDELRNRTCDITLGGFQTIQTRPFSTLRNITVTEKSKLDIKLDYKQVTFDEPQSFPFNIPKNYTAK